ncbi:hypothetical protein D3C81_1744370 [compost metagenome]
MIQPRAVTQIGRWRRQTDTRRAITRSRITVTHRTMLCVQGRATSRVRGNDRGLADFIGHRQLRTELPRLTGDIRAVLMCGNRVMQCAKALLQPGLLWVARHASDQGLHCLDEFNLFAVFGLVDHLARLHRLRIIRADIVEQMLGLRGAFHRSGQQVEAAQGKDRR